ncbi:hypothetical protein BD626DRAFT_479797 [Schizophyllum amplum]|uniref:Uncharacterized protein n=1 Tax=Schizophyllum amplum TaxID=97359 RepID=A0A550CSK6_9AGAR|nr:hypothetical protein BD626DRAFT_479797 [Auriculariopsis ampla]
MGHASRAARCRCVATPCALSSLTHCRSQHTGFERQPSLPAPLPLQHACHGKQRRAHARCLRSRDTPLPTPAVHPAERPPLEYSSHRAFAARYSAAVYSYGPSNLAHGGDTSGALVRHIPDRGYFQHPSSHHHHAGLSARGASARAARAVRQAATRAVWHE